MLVNNDISSFNLFGEEFANYVTSKSDCIDYQIREYHSSILFVSREEILKIFQKDESILLKYLQFNSEKTKFLSEKIQMLSLKTIRAKLAHYILNLHSEEHLAHSGSFTITMKNNQTELAAYFGVTRPSLARELSGMARDGLITINKKMVTITNLKGLMEARG